MNFQNKEGRVLLVVLVAFFLLFAVLLGRAVIRRNNLFHKYNVNVNSVNKNVVPPVKPGASNGSNPFGVMLPTTMDISRRIEIAKELGAAYIRPSDLKINLWNGSCSECDAVVNSGLGLVLTVRNGGGGGTPSTPPSNYDEYKKNLSEILNKYKPALLVVENEENSHALFYSGNSKEYLTELKAACEVARSQNIKCTDGGMVSSLVVGLVADNYKKMYGKAKADEFVKKTLSPEDLATYERGIKSPKADQILEEGMTLLTGFKGAGADYVNFHWYNANPESLGETVSFLESQSGLSALSNETGQHMNEDPNQVTAIMTEVVKLKLPFAIWYSIDTPGFAQARALIDSDGSLRPNGVAYKEFNNSNFSK